MDIRENYKGIRKAGEEERNNECWVGKRKGCLVKERKDALAVKGENK